MSDRTEFNSSEPIYVCFHCKKALIGDVEAAGHFGSENAHKPECWLYPRDMREILQQNADLRWFVEQFFNGIDTGMIDISSPADDILANVLSRGRKAAAQIANNRLSRSDRGSAEA